MVATWVHVDMYLFMSVHFHVTAIGFHVYLVCLCILASCQLVMLTASVSDCLMHYLR